MSTNIFNSGVVLSDLTFIEESNPDFSHGGLINFAKSRLIYKIISQIQIYQNVPYTFVSVYQISCMHSFDGGSTYLILLQVTYGIHFTGVIR
jgi:hypothetical protein